MGMTNTMATEIAKMIINDTPLTFVATNARIGVGSNATTFSAAQTNLIDGSAVRKLVNTAPTRSGANLTFVATFATNEANFNWREWGIFRSATGGVMMNRKVETASALGTKTSASQWVMSVTIGVQAA